MSVSLISLVERLKNKEPSAQRELYNLFSVPMFNLCLRLMNSRTEAEDVFQSSFVKVFENIDKLSNPLALPGWVKRIFINTSIDALRKRNIVFVPLEFISSRTCESSIDDGLILEDLTRLINRLPTRCKCVFILFEIEGYSHLEIAELLNISEGTSKSQLAFARKKLKDAYNSSNFVDFLNLNYELE